MLYRSQINRILFRSIVLFVLGGLPVSCGAPEDSSSANSEATAGNSVASPDEQSPSKQKTSSGDNLTSPQEQEQTGEQQGAIHGEEVDYEAGEVKLQGYLAYNAEQKGERPGILIVHEWWGHNDYVRKRARMLAEIGYTALALDMFGKGKKTTHPETAKQFVKEVLEDMRAAEKRFNTALELLKKHESTDPKKMAAIGYCFGGGVVLHMARVGADLDGVATFHGSLEGQKKAKPGVIKAKLLVFNGEADPFVPEDQVKNFKKEMKKAKAKLEFVNIPGAKHAFTNPAATELGTKYGLPLEYNEAADKQSWEKFKSFLAKLW